MVSHGLSPGEKRVLGSFRQLRQALPTLTQAAGAVLLAVYPLWVQPWRGLSALMGVVLALVGALWALLLQPTRNALFGRIEQLERHITAHEAPNSERMTFLLETLLNALGLTGPEHRASVFVRKDDGAFTLVGRHSANGEYRTPSQTSYGADQGLVAATWRDIKSYIADLPTTRPAWDKAVARKFNMDFEEVCTLRMQSRSYGCLRVDRQNGAVTEPVGVLIIESTDNDGIKPEMLDQIDRSLAWQLLPTECHMHIILGRLGPLEPFPLEGSLPKRAQKGGRAKHLAKVTPIP